MKLSLASAQDIAIMLAFTGQLNDLMSASPQFPRIIDKVGESTFAQDDEQFFDIDNDEHAAEGLRRLMKTLDFAPSAHNRVIWGFDTFIRNNIHNPDLDHLDIHPDFQELMGLRSKNITGLRIIPMLQAMEWNGHAIHPNAQFATACPCCLGINPNHPNADYFEKTDHGHKPDCLLHRIIANEKIEALAENSQDLELRRWQDTIRDLLCDLSGNDGSGIDGGGCESGDPLDFTLAEIRQAWAHSFGLAGAPQKMLSIESVIKAIADEPEYPGEAPVKLKQLINQAFQSNDQEHVLHMLRQTVRLTKECITERVQKLP